MDEKKNGINNETKDGNGSKAPVKGLKKLIDTARRKYDEIRYSKWGKIGAKVLTAAGLIGVGKTCYDKGIAKGKASAVPTVVTIERMPETDPAEEEAPEEEIPAEETV